MFTRSSILTRTVKLNEARGVVSNHTEMLRFDKVPRRAPKGIPLWVGQAQTRVMQLKVTVWVRGGELAPCGVGSSAIRI